MTRLLPESIETARLRLRQPLVTDAETIFASYATDQAVCRYMIWRPHESVAVTRRFVEECIASWQTGDHQPYIVVEISSNTLLGMLDARIQGQKVDIGYVLARAHWSKGFMTEAVDALTKLALAQAAIYRVQATCDVENAA